MLAPALAGRTLSAVKYTRDGAGQSTAFFSQDDLSGLPQVFSVAVRNGQWQSPLQLPIANGNARTLLDAATLGTGTQMLLLRGDDTDYLRMFNLTAPPTPSADPDAPIIPGITNDALQQLLSNNQRLMFMLQAGGQWLPPMTIRDTYRPLEAVLAPGPGNDALAVFTRRPNAQSTSANDVEVYATAFHGSVWSPVFRLTNNTTPEFGLRAVYAGGRYLVTWLRDADSDLSTVQDRVLEYTEVATTGDPGTSGAIANVSSAAGSLAALGTWQGAPILMWETTVTTPTGPAQELWQSIWAGNWSAPRSTGIRSTGFMGATFGELGGRLFLLRIEGRAVRAAYNAGAGWLELGALFDSAVSGLGVAQFAYGFDEFSGLSVLMAGSMQVAATEDDEVPEGLWYTQVPMLPDLAVSFVNSGTPLRLNSDAVLNIQVANAGRVASGTFTLVVAAGGSAVATLPGSSLAPGATQAFQATVHLAHADTPVIATVQYPGAEVSTANNSASYTARVLPDYVVRSVTRQGATTLTADVAERKGVAGPPVSVDFYLQQGAQRTRIASGSFDPNVAAPVAVDWAGLATLTGPFQIVAVANEQRLVREDGYGNNVGSYTFNPQADLTISRVLVTADTVTVTVRNQGALPVAAADLLLTDNPAVAGATAAGGTPAPLWFNAVNFGTSNETEVTIPRSALGTVTGQNLYAVVNPYGTVRESDRNNNLVKTLFASANIVQPPGGPGSIGSLRLRLGPVRCGAITARVRNRTDAVVAGAAVTLLTQQGAAVAVQSIPTLAARASEEVTFNNLAPGPYTARLTVPLADGTLGQLERKVTLHTPTGNECGGQQ